MDIAFLDMTTLVLPTILLAITLAIVMSVISFFCQLRLSRLPEATRHDDLRERCGLLVSELERRREELRDVEQQIQNRDRLAGEAAALQERLEALRLEHESLEFARQEIDEAKAEAARVAEELAEVSGKLEEARREHEQLAADLHPGNLEQIREERQRLRAERDSLHKLLPELRSKRDTALRAIEEMRQAETRREVLREAAAQLERDMALRQNAGAELDRQREEATARLAAVRQKHDALKQQNVELAARVEALKAERERHGGGGAIEVDEAEVLADLIGFPTALATPDRPREGNWDEQGALANVDQLLKDHGLEFSRRTVRAFHTALKINDHAQMTVLAGVSGTGKSLLPRRYAEAMGIHFLQIAVEPRWDSPQDLLGFYNYVEQKYKATDFARLLVHLDPYRTIEVPGNAKDRRDHMGLALLDEMNLARIEYYFSEMLSRLEVRPPRSEAQEDARRRNAMIPIDVRGLQRQLALYPAHNVLFVGTMNEDESTQALSDKVLDRGNVLQFAAPHVFRDTTPKKVRLPEEAMTVMAWRDWIRPIEQITHQHRRSADEAIEKLAGVMEGFGRPFGHRLRDAMLAYVANYPFSSDDTMNVSVALADQVEFRILPKLRGIVIDDHRESFDGLIKLLREDLHDEAFADRLEDVRQRSDRASGLFIWRGLSRED